MDECLHELKAVIVCKKCGKQFDTVTLLKEANKPPDLNIHAMETVGADAQLP